VKSQFQKLFERLHFHAKKISEHRFFVDNISRGRTHLLILSTRAKEIMPTKQQARDFWKEHHHRMVYIAIFFVICSVIIHANVRADVGSVNLYATNCSGSWQHPEHAMGAPDVVGGGTDFSSDNSAVPIHNPSYMDCAGFKGNIPDGVVPKKIIVHLSWGVNNTPPSDSSDDTAATTTASSVQENLATTTNLIEDDAVSAPDLVPLPDSGNSDAASPAVPPTASSSESASDTPDVTPSIPDTITIPDASNTIDVTTSTSAVNQDASDTTASTSVIQNTDTNVIPVTPDLPEQDFIGLQYTLDGTTWNNLGSINGTNWENISFEINDSDISKWENISNLQIRVSTLLPDSQLPNLYIDSVYLEADYQDIPKISDPPKITLKDSSVVLDGKTDFGSDETPTFVVTDPGLTTSDIQTLVDNNQAQVLQDTRGLIDVQAASSSASSSDVFDVQKNVIDPVINNVEQGISNTTNNVTSFLAPSIAEAAESSATISDAQVLDADGGATDIPVAISTIVVNGVNKQQISITKPSRAFRPGKYTLKLSLNTAQAIIVSEQDFTWGVLTVNTDKSVYSPGDQAFLQFGVINDMGHTICDADLSLLITGPDGNTYPFASANNSISQSGECRGDSYVTVPDYSADFVIPKQVGNYTMTLTATTINGTRSITSHFSVEDHPAFDVVRTGPTRIYPVSPYPVSFKITSPVDWSGVVVEKLPSNFDVNPASYPDQYTSVTTSNDGQTKIISWDVSLSAGTSTTIGYYFNAPEISPQFYLLGPLSFFSSGDDISTATPVFKESRQWQIADDAVCTATISGTWNTVNTGGVWSGCTGTAGTPGTSDDVTINPGVTITLGAATPVVNSLTIAGTLNTSAVSNFGLNSKTISISSTGTLTANNSTITLSGTAVGTLMSITGSGVFNAGGSTVSLTGLGSNTINSAGFTGSNALKNLTISSSGFVKTLGANIVMTGTLNITAGTLDTSSVGNYSISTGNLISTSIATAILNGNSSTMTFTSTATSSTLISRGSLSVFNTSNTNFIVTSDAALTIFAGSVTVACNNLTLSPVLTTNRLYTFQGSSAIITMNGNLDINPSGTGILTVTAGSGINVTNIVYVRGSGGATSVFNSQTTLILTSVNISSGDTYNAGNGGVVTFNGVTDTPITGTGTFTDGTTSISFTGTHATTNVQIPANTYGPVTFNKAGETYMLTGNIVVSGAISLANGTLNTSGSNYSITGTSLSVTGTSTAILNSNSSTITLNGAFSIGAGGVANTSNSNFFIVGDAAISIFQNVTSMHNLTLDPVLTTSRAWTLNAGSAILTISGAFDIVPSGTGLLTVTQGSTVNVSGGSTIEGSGGATSILSGGSQAFNTSTLLIATTGTYSPTSAILTLSATSTTPFTVNGTFTQNTSTVTFTGGQTAGNGGTSIPAINYHHLTLNNSADTYYLTGTTTLDSTGILTITNGTLNTQSSSTSWNLTTGKISLSATGVFVANGSVITLDDTTGATSPATFSINGGGTFTAGTSTVIYNSDANVASMFSGTISFNNLKFSPAMSASRTWTCVAGSNFTLTMNNLTINPSSVSGSPQLNIPCAGAGFTVASSGTFLMNPTASATVSFNPTGAVSVGNLDMESGATLVQTGNNTVTVNGNTSTPFIFKPGATYTKNAAGCTILFTGGSGTTSVPGLNYYNLTLNSSGVTFVPIDNNINIDPGGTLTVTLGTFDTTSANNYAISAGHISIAASQTFNANASILTLTGISGNLVARSGAFNYGNSTVSVASASGNPVLNSGSGNTFYNLTINSTATVINSGFSETIAHNFLLQSGVFNQFEVSSVGMVGNATGTFTMNSGTTFCDGGSQNATTATCDSGATYPGGAPFPTNFISSNISIDPNSTFIYLASNPNTISSTPTYGNLVFRPVLIANITYTLGPNFSAKSLDIFPGTASTTSLNLNVNLGSGGLNVTNSLTIESTASTTSVLDPTSSNYPISAGSIFINSGDTLLGRGSSITISNNWTNNGTFTQNTSNVIFNSTSTSIISGTSTTFYKLSITPPSGAKEVDFATSSTPIFSVTNLFTATGHTGALVKIRSLDPGVQWKFNPTGTASVSFVDVKNSGCQGGAITMVTTTSLNNGNNDTCWGFVPYLTFNISSGSVGFGNLNSSGSMYATSDGLGSSTDVEGNNITVVSYAAGGYSLTVFGKSLSAGGYTLPGIGNINIPGIPGVEQFGIHAIATGGSGIVQAPYSGSGFGFPNNANTVQSVVASESLGDGVPTTYSMHYIANVASNTPAGKYTTALTYVLTGTF